MSQACVLLLCLAPRIKTNLMICASYFTSVFVSLGVFLFGYDQGVMSGIITYVSSSRPASPSVPPAGVS